jgi:hypothetical protein
MNTLDSIQADIIFLSNQKENFISRLFSSKKERLLTLSNEESRLINLSLYNTNEEFKKLADFNNDLLKNTHWQMKVLERTHGGRNLAFTTQIEGEIKAKGYAYGNRITGYSLLNKNPSKYVGKIDYLGKFNLIAVDSGVDSFSIAKILKCFTNEAGDLVVEKEKEEKSFTHDTHIKFVMGDPFNGNETKRNKFLQNKKELLRLISNLKIKI